jgi:hypothetical protein
MKLLNSRKAMKVSLVLSVAALVSSGCGSSSTAASGTSAEDTSASGAAAGAAGGSLSGSSSTGTLAFLSQPAQSRSWLYTARDVLNPLPSAYASNLCPTFKSSATSGCEVTGSTMWLTYDDCNFGGGKAMWTGTQALTMSTGSATCGTFPNPGDSGTLTRQYVSAAGSTTPSLITVESAKGVDGAVDDSTPNLGNFNGDTIATVENGGYGNQVTFNSHGARSSINLEHRIYATGAFDHSITGSLTIEENAGATTRVISGEVTVYHNLLKVIGTATFNAVIHSDTCCFPTGGSITTKFAAGSNLSEPPTKAGLAYVGATESLSFTGCGTATYTAIDQTVTNVTLARCF